MVGAAANGSRSAPADFDKCFLAIPTPRFTDHYASTDSRGSLHPFCRDNRMKCDCRQNREVLLLDRRWSVHAASEEGRPLPPNVLSDWLAAPLVPRRPVLKNLPTGTVTFLFTDTEGAT